MPDTVMVVPAGGKETAVKALNSWIINPMKSKIFDEGHAPTNFKRWVTATEHYEIAYADRCALYVTANWIAQF